MTKKAFKIALFSILLVVGVFGRTMFSVDAATVKYSGKDGSLNWSIDTDGHLTVSGSGSYEGTYTSVSYKVNGTTATDSDDMPNWIAYREEIKTATVSVSNITDTSYFFAGCTNLTSVNLSGLSTTSAKKMRDMFLCCGKLTSLNLSGFNTAKVTDMYGVFKGCTGLTSLNLSGFNTAKVTNMMEMFSGCNKLESLDVSSFDVTNVTSAYGMLNMFKGCGSLQMIKSPKNIALEVALPSENDWYDANGNACTVMTQNLSTSMTYTTYKCEYIKNAAVDAIATQTFTGKALTPEPRVTYNGAVLQKGVDYTLSYANNVNPGTATITINGLKKYLGSKTVTFNIKVVLAKSKISSADFTYAKGNVGKLSTKIYYTLYIDFIPVSYAKQYEIQVFNNKGKKVKSSIVNCEGKGYVEKSFKNLTASFYSVRIRAIRDGVYGAWSSRKYVVKQPRAQARTIKGYVQIKWEKISGATGYDIYMSTKRNSGYKKVASAGKSTTLKTIKKFNKKKLKKRTYYYYVVAKKKVSGKTYKSTKSFVYKVKNK